VAHFQLVLLVHAHQPVGNFNDVFERSYANSYLPFVEVLEKHPSIRIGVHYSGPLLEWIESAHPEYFERLRTLVKAGQVEFVGGGFYEPVLVAIPQRDRVEQIKRLADYIEKRFETRPTGAWLTERVWEPQIPSSLAPAGVDYTLVDDNHFVGAGFEYEQLYGYYTVEDLGHKVKLIPGLKMLRYMIPFRDAGETIGFLRDASAKHPVGFAAMGDDLEKFGSWPGTYEHCYTNGWLTNFFSALEQCRDWLDVTTPSMALSAHQPLGRADLPTASYTEMMEWSLPTPARLRYHGLVEEFASRPEALPFLRGGIWRNFFTKYYESNLLHKKMLYVSEKMVRLEESKRRSRNVQESRNEASTLLLRAQCNDAYWHGIFGGLYAPHLRTALWRSLVQAESIADRLDHTKRNYSEVKTFDFDSDGSNEAYFTSDKYAALVSPIDGGTISAIDFRPCNATLINSLMRRSEAYHASLRDSGSGNPLSVQSIHDQKRAKEEGLERWLHYDHWRRHAFRLIVFPQSKTYEDCEAVRLEEDAAIAGGAYTIKDISSTHVALSTDSPEWAAEKAFSFHPTEKGFDIVCDTKLIRKGHGSTQINIGIEVVINFLAPSAPDRYFRRDGKRFPLRLAAAVPAMDLSVVDEWQTVEVGFEAPAAQTFWIAPIETVSESEDGFERIYQGSQVMAVWPVKLDAGAEWKGQLVLRVRQTARLD
jgi:alpha-amylase/alpha-mannosidase (GH57 family)